MACATALTDLQQPVTVLEASAWVGGLARSFELWGQTVDLGPHRFFSPDRIVVDFWRRFVEDDFILIDRLTRISYQGQLFHYPLQALDALGKLGPQHTLKALSSYSRARLRPRPSRSFEDWVINRFGAHLYQIFFKTYTEKLWGIPCTQIDTDWAAQRIKKLSLSEAIKHAFLKDRSKTHKTLLDQFAYPRQGAGIVYQRMQQYIHQQGGQIRLQSPVKRILLERGRATGVELVSGEQLPAQHIVSSMPLTRLVQALPATPPEILRACQQLRFRNTILVYLNINSENVFPDNWIYIHAAQVQIGRVTNFRNWGANQGPNSILCAELWCFDEDPLWSDTDHALENRVAQELRQIGLLQPQHHVLASHTLRLHRSYPVYALGYQAPLKQIQAYLDTIPNLHVIGRYGAFKYNNQDHSILMGLLAAAQIQSGTSQNLWGINADDQYQESAEVRTLYAKKAS